MPTEINHEPTISEIYAAFDGESHRIFRSAMAKSRGGIVRVGDLRAALCESTAIPNTSFPSFWSCRQSDNAPRLTPMSNEPALRKLLRAAFQIAIGEAEQDRCTITPATLLAATLDQAHCRGTPSGSDVITEERSHVHPIRGNQTCRQLPEVVTPQMGRRHIGPVEVSKQIEALFSCWARQHRPSSSP